MAGNDRAHFEVYREQTRVKHEILEKYLFAYFNILKSNHNNLIYVDGFAGPGMYKDGNGSQIDGSPVRALKKIVSLPDLAKRVGSIFIEKDQILAVQLAKTAADFRTKHPEIKEPRIYVGPFAEQLQRGLDALEEKSLKLAPTFLFVDPCGVAGASFAAIQRFLAQEWCEVLVFFNIDGVRRILGLGERMKDTLAELLGSDERARLLLGQVLRQTTPAAKEQVIVSFYEGLLRSETPAKYVTMFRIEKEEARATSHYLVHASRYHLGFGIMKDVMWGVGKTSDGFGGLAFEQASDTGSALLFSPRWDAIKESVLSELRNGPRIVSYFSKTLVWQPDNKLCSKAYKKALLELEAESRIVVLNKNGIGIAPPRRAGTIGDDYYVRLA